MTVSKNQIRYGTANPHRFRRLSLGRLYGGGGFEEALAAAEWQHAWLRGPGGWDAYAAWTRGKYSAMDEDERRAAYFLATGAFPEDGEPDAIEEADIYAADEELAQLLTWDEPYVDIEPPWGHRPDEYLWRPS